MVTAQLTQEMLASLVGDCYLDLRSVAAWTAKELNLRPKNSLAYRLLLYRPG